MPTEPSNLLLDWVSNQGFAIVVAGYLLVTMNRTLKELTKVITDLHHYLKITHGVNEE